MPEAPERAVVLGGAGFLGSHTADALSDRGYAVTIFDLQPSRWLRADQRMMVGEILDRAAVREAIAGAAYVYHFAAIADIAEARRRSYETVHVNVMGTANALQACIEEGVRRFVYASTLYVYSPLGSVYRATKQAAENVIEAYQETHGLEYTLLRYGSLYGPRAQKWNGLKSYVTQVIRERRMLVEGDEQRLREYIHVCDAARLSVDVLSPRYANRAVTVTGAQVLTTSQLAQMIFEIAGVDLNVVVTPPDPVQLHYQTTPYRYTPKQASKLVPSEFVDIGQGILELVEEVSRLEETGAGE